MIKVLLRVWLVALAAAPAWTTGASAQPLRGYGPPQPAVTPPPEDINDLLRSGYCWREISSDPIFNGLTYRAVQLFESFDVANYAVTRYHGQPALQSKRNRDRIFVRTPCPQPEAPPGGWYVGPEAALALAFLFNLEEARFNNVPTFASTDRSTGAAGGAIIGANIPVGNGVMLSPFASVDVMDNTVQHTFPGGSTLGTKSRLMVEAGVKGGPQLANGTWFYGIAAVGLLNEELHVNFVPVSSSTNATVPGVGIGVGAAFHPAFLQGFGAPASLFVEYQHLWWEDAHFDMPASSPAFNYTFRRDDDLIKVGLTFAFGAPPVSPAPVYPVKASPTK